jgi:DNA polymerase III sliding clamp (beta) subunit (PCNA family)
MKIKDLILAVSASAKKDIRYYLNGVLITNKYMAASDGYKLVRILREDDIALPDDIDKILIPIEAVNSFIKKITKKDHERHFEVVKMGESYALQHGNAVEIFTPIDAKYLDFQKAFDKIEAERSLPNADTQYNYEYLGAAQKAINAYLGNQSPKRFNRRDTIGYFEPTDAIIYIVMPCIV